ncbi:hypothetical protein Leryth_014828 [Lithospermum erythrorhizon]|nr:hypothetical protein Leryth_014828 [Lithospermum erythrorhizon]
MGQTVNRRLLRFLIYLCLSSLVQSFNDTLNQSLDSILHTHAFKSLFHPHPQTGFLYNATVPSNLAGMKISVERLRSRTLWRKGANFSDFSIPSRTLTSPYVKRLLIVYHDLGNWSSYYNISGYSLISKVVGFVVYDASRLNVTNLTRIDLNTMGKKIQIKFQNSSSPNAKCVAFDARGKVLLSNMILQNTCYSRSQGYFSIVMPNRRKQKISSLWLIMFLLGFVLLIFAGLVGLVFCRMTSTKRSHVREKEDDGEVLETVWIHGSKMPRAIATRSHPILETTGTL